MERLSERSSNEPLGEGLAPTNIASSEWWRTYLDACRLAEGGRRDEARARYRAIEEESRDTALRALVNNDLAVLNAVEGDFDRALTGIQSALAIDGRCKPALSNLALLQSEELAAPGFFRRNTGNSFSAEPVGGDEVCKVAILSLLFNWPSTGGGIIHTVELAKFLGEADYQVKHFYARHPTWGIGEVQQTLPIPSEPLDFAESTWSISGIQSAYRRAVDRFAPDCVIITDCWNFKPHLAEAVAGYRCFLRQQALECLCPLNNLRLIVERDGQVRQCPHHQLATPQACRQCLRLRGSNSGRLHQAERALSCVEDETYIEKLYRALHQSEAVLVLNPLIAETISPYARSVRVVPWGMDPGRFPWPWPSDADSDPRNGIKTIFMAGLVSELIKGFHVLHNACERLWKKRHDFELVATGEPAGRIDEFTRFVGWLSQEELPKYIRKADMLVMPTIAQEGLGRTTVEAMAIGRPVVASRIGGLPYTVRDGVTGQLFEPGNTAELAEKIERLLDDPELRCRMGMAGRRVFEEEYTWEEVIGRHYRPLLATRRARGPA